MKTDKCNSKLFTHKHKPLFAIKFQVAIEYIRSKYTMYKYKIYNVALKLAYGTQTCMKIFQVTKRLQSPHLDLFCNYMA